MLALLKSDITFAIPIRYCDNKGEYSSVGLEHLPYKQGVVGSNPTTPTFRKAL